jgi:hypothetical protein
VITRHTGWNRPQAESLGAPLNRFRRVVVTIITDEVTCIITFFGLIMMSFAAPFDLFLRTIRAKFLLARIAGMKAVFLALLAWTANDQFTFRCQHALGNFGQFKTVWAKVLLENTRAFDAIFLVLAVLSTFTASRTAKHAENDSNLIPSINFLLFLSLGLEGSGAADRIGLPGRSFSRPFLRPSLLHSETSSFIALGMLPRGLCSSRLLLSEIGLFAFGKHGDSAEICAEIPNVIWQPWFWCLWCDLFWLSSSNYHTLLRIVTAYNIAAYRPLKCITIRSQKRNLRNTNLGYSLYAVEMYHYA